MDNVATTLDQMGTDSPPDSQADNHQTNIGLPGTSGIRTTLDLVAEGIIVSDKDGRVTAINRAALEMLDTSETDMLGSSLEQVTAFMTPLEDGGLTEIARQAADPGSEVVEMAGQILQVSTVQTKNGDELTVTLLHDITVPVKTEHRLTQLRLRVRELEVQAESLRQVDHLKSRFIADMSHDLRNPLNSIIGFSSVILKGIDGPITDLQREDLGKINSSGKALLDMVSDMLDVSELWAGKIQLKLSNTDINKLAAEAVSRITEEGIDKPIDIDLDLNPEVPQVQADWERVLQVMQHLLTNAVNYTDAGTVTIATTPNDERVIVSIEDTGIGIPPQYLESVFDEFFQVDDPAARKAGGMGLGLSVSRRLVEMHGGEIWVESAPGIGSTFYFSLPVGGPPGE